MPDLQFHNGVMQHLCRCDALGNSRVLEDPCLIGDAISSVLGIFDLPYPFIEDVSVLKRSSGDTSINNLDLIQVDTLFSRLAISAFFSR